MLFSQHIYVIKKMYFCTTSKWRRKLQWQAGGEGNAKRLQRRFLYAKKDK